MKKTITIALLATVSAMFVAGFVSTLATQQAYAISSASSAGSSTGGAAAGSTVTEDRSSSAAAGGEDAAECDTGIDSLFFHADLACLGE
jgi:hypothetical protein